MTTTTWRDLASELTADQVASMERAEATLPAGRDETQAALIGFARDYIELNGATAVCASIPVPPGAVADSWEVKTAGGVNRRLEWHSDYSTVDGVAVAIDGTQEQNGDFTRSVTVYSDEAVRLSAVEAREVAAALLAAADEFDRLNGDAPPFM